MADDEQQQEQQDGGEEQPSEEEIRAQLEEEIKKVRVEDVILQSLVSVLNLGARRIAKEDERDLEQGKLGIDAARALVEFVPEDAQKEIRQALSELQLLYAKQTEGGDDSGEDTGAGEEPESGSEQGSSTPPKGDSGLWTPPTAG